MNKLPGKQIYLLVIIIVGIIALSLYSTYAIFTFDSETSDAISISLPSVLKIDSNMYEYKQVDLPKKSNITTDIDIYNTFDYSICYSIWYKVVGKNNNVSVFELNDEKLTTSGTLEPNTNYRIRLLLTNNENKAVKVNLGLVTDENNGTCSLNLSTDKLNVKSFYKKSISYLYEEIKNIKAKDDKTAGYLSYNNIVGNLEYDKQTKIYQELNIDEDKFNLSNELTNNISETNFNESNYYICSSPSCKIALKINELEESNDKIIIKEYNELEMHSSGISGIKKIDNNYYYYGPNPDNFIYYNCDKYNNCELWRIIGLFYNEETQKYDIKIIKNDSIGKYEFDSNSNNFNDSSLNKYLNKSYEITLDYQKYISDYHSNYELINDLNTNIKNIEKIKTTSKVSLINITDYVNTSSCNKEVINDLDECRNSNWLARKKIDKEWTMSAYNETLIDEITLEETINNMVFNSSLTLSLPEEKLDVRPVLYLNNRVLLFSGDGSLNNPYIIK